MALLAGQRLIVHNLSIHSEAADLFGGFKPVSFAKLMSPLVNLFMDLFQRRFDQKANNKFITRFLESISSASLSEMGS